MSLVKQGHQSLCFQLRCQVLHFEALPLARELMHPALLYNDELPQCSIASLPHCILVGFKASLACAFIFCNSSEGFCRCIAATDEVSLELLQPVHLTHCNFTGMCILQSRPDWLMEGCNVQVEVHPHWRNQRLLDFCKDKGIHVTAYGPLTSPGNMAGKFPILLKVRSSACRHSG